MLRTFIDEPSPNVGYFALEDLELPAPALQQLAADAEPLLGRKVARHPNVTDALLDHLLSAPDPQVVDDAAANSALRPTQMYRILTAAGL
ncbi:hypothetical protein [Streptomyces melanogenes]|uniref:hypothetical protein n=1 Tax=Streptomyces melanogenes TaxID=67326 RepID=UPI00378DBD25